MNRIIIFGGTFNPPHIGHSQIVSHLSRLDPSDSVFLIPTKVPPHKSVNHLADEKDRLNMLSIIADRFANVFVSDIELKRSGKSYTVDTLREIKRLYPDKKIALTVGADMLVTFDTWKNYEEIIRLAEIITFYRGSSDQVEYKQWIDKLRSLGAEITEIDECVASVSSTEVRNALSVGLGASEMLDADILEYIERSGLYRV